MSPQLLACDSGLRQQLTSLAIEVDTARDLSSALQDKLAHVRRRYTNLILVLF